MHDKTILVTGGTSGIGAAAARALACKGATVVIVGRDLRKCRREVKRIQDACGHPHVHALLADLSSQQEIRRLAGEFQERFPTLDVLINNAGGIFNARRESADGLEMTFALNHLGYFLPTLLLADLLRASPAGRVIVVASHAHENMRMDFDDLQSARRYDRLLAYGRSKLANLLFAYELARRLKGSRVTVNAMTPGSVATNLGSNNGWFRAKVRNMVYRAKGSMLSPEDAARTVIYLAGADEVRAVTGRYFRDEKPVPSSDASYDVAAAHTLWCVSEDLTGTTGLLP